MIVGLEHYMFTELNSILIVNSFMIAHLGGIVLKFYKHMEHNIEKLHHT
jgi:hypothetical protein